MTRPGRVMSHHLNKYGYPKLSLSGEGRKKLVSVHRLVAEAFIPNPEPQKNWVLHKDDNPENNKVDNLYWGDQFDNEQDKIANGNHPYSRRTHCAKGHEYTDGNTYTPPGTNYRQCKTCRSERITARNDKVRQMRKDSREGESR